MGQDGFRLMPAEWGWVFPHAWAPCKTTGPLFHPSGGALRKAEVEFLADLAG